MVPNHTLKDTKTVLERDYFSHVELFFLSINNKEGLRDSEVVILFSL